MATRIDPFLTSRRKSIARQQLEGWENALTGLPKGMYRFWDRHLRPKGYRLRCQIVDFPKGMPGDVGTTLSWADKWLPSRLSGDKPDEYLSSRQFKRSKMRTIALDEAVSSIPNGASLMIGGFMGVGTPERLVDELVRQGKRDLTVIANDTAKPNVGIGKLISAKAVRKVIASHIGTNSETQQQMIAGMTEVELVPQGTLIERIRAGGFGLGGILTPTGVGTVVEEGKRRIDVDGKSYLLETALRADFALVHAFLADYSGNLSYALTARNFNPVIAMTGDTVIVTAEHIVPVGVIAPDHVITPAPLVDYLVANT